MSNSGTQTQQINSGNDVLELVRVVKRKKHKTFTDQKEEADFVIRNNTDGEKGYIFLPLKQFKPNLEIFDENGTKLNIFPNSEVEELLETIKKDDPDAYQDIKSRFEDVAYKILIQLPDNKPIKPGELRTITLKSGQSQSVEFHRVTDAPIICGWFTHWKRKFFTVPSFVARANRTVSQQHSEFFVVEGPQEYSTVAEESDKNIEGLYENGYGEDTKILSTRLPPVDSKGYTWKLRYEFLPHRKGIMRLLAIFMTISFSTAIFLIIFQLLYLSGEMSQLPIIFETDLRTIGQTYSAGIISGTVGVMYGIRAEWAERYRILSMIPLLLHISSWAIWHIPK